ncbi:hypothetical protein N7510_010486 [Penicillium lagena]|uniref:uncharacterized protein n=1 Tax=Penicillium lagena TaxID=94218 RepID=UPI00253F76DD|nr:uncharacterized protein N7510_010486 [Penicillium lagena]KAJ5605332.1 hypothetical protein N7510_010486 [Penicillium lagena]
MAPSSLNAPKRKRGRPRKYTSAEQRQESKITEQRQQRQAARAIQRTLEFDQYYSTTEHPSADLDPSLPTYFPPGEPTIPTELEQLLPPPSPQGEPYELAVDDLPATDDLSLNDDLPLNDILPPNDDLPLNDDLPSINDASEPLTRPNIEEEPEHLEEPERPTTDEARLISDLAQTLTDQLYEHHGCCRQCHEQQQSEHDAQHATHTSLGEYMSQVQTDGG